jgi:acetolactate synthase-1/2/3 large subunit
MVRQWQDLFFEKRYSSTDLINPDFVALAAAYGIKAGRITGRKELQAGITEMLDCEGPYLLEIKVEREGNVLPMVEPGSSVSEIRLMY